MHKFHLARQFLAKHAALALLLGLMLPIAVPKPLVAFGNQAQASTQSQISEQQYLKYVEEARTWVPEFNFIRDLAKQMGVRVWLFGGTAAGFAHYAHWDLMRLSGDTRFQPDRFTYDYTDIFRSTQDLDIAVDGTLQQVAEFQSALSSKYPHFLGAKAGWEARSLRFARGKAGDVGYKEALLNDFDFNNQNTDSNSLGMVELSVSSNPLVTDLKEMAGAHKSQFLKDVLTQRITFYRSPSHNRTSRFINESNPEVFSVIRALTKAFQYDLTFADDDIREMKAIIDAFDIRSIQTPDAKRRFKDISIKLVKHAVNIEYALDTLYRLGLRQKLLQFDDKNQSDSLAFWLNKEPLRSYPLSRGRGKTALEVFREHNWLSPKGELIVTHETNSFLAYESITRAHTGEPNVFISRRNTAGEAASYGDGFYAQAGLQGARGTKLPIRFHLNPQARACLSETDFNCDFWMAGKYLVIRNKNAIRVIPESLNLSLSQYMSILQNGDDLTDNKALLEKFNRRIGVLSEHITVAELALCRQIVSRALENVADPQNLTVLTFWFSLPLSKQRPEDFKKFKSAIQKIIAKNDQDVIISLANQFLSQPYSNEMGELLGLVLEKASQENLRSFIRNSLSEPHAKEWTGAVRVIIERGDQTTLQHLISLVFQQPFTAGWPDLAESFAKKASQENLRSFIRNSLSEPHAKEWTGAVRVIIERGDQTTLQHLISLVFQQPFTAGWPDLAESFAKKASQENLRSFIRTSLSEPHAKEWTGAVRVIIERGDQTTLQHLISLVFQQPFTAGWPDLAESFAKKASQENLRSFIRNSLSKPHAKEWTGAVRVIIERGEKQTLEVMAKFLNENPGLRNSSIFFQALSIPNAGKRRAFLNSAIGPVAAPSLEAGACQINFTQSSSSNWIEKVIKGLRQGR